VLRLTELESRATQRVASAAPTAQAAAPTYARHVSERMLLHALVQAHYPEFIARLEAEDRSLRGYVRDEFEAFLRCGVLNHGFLRVVCEQCQAERLLAFSCKKRGFCPSCGARRMAESARHLVEEVFGPRPVRQWALSFPYPLRFLLASRPEIIGPVLGIVHRVIAGWLVDHAGVEQARAPRSAQLTQLARKIAHRVCCHLSRHSWLECEDESAFLSDCAGCHDGLDALRMRPKAMPARSAAFRCMRVSRPMRTRAGSSSAFVATSRAQRFRKSAYRSRRRKACVTSSIPRGETARRTWSSSR